MDELEPEGENITTVTDVEDIVIGDKGVAGEHATTIIGTGSIASSRWV